MLHMKLDITVGNTTRWTAWVLLGKCLPRSRARRCYVTPTGDPSSPARGYTAS